MSDMYCSKCGVSFQRQAILALMIDLCGARASSDPSDCVEGGGHEFVEREAAAPAGRGE